MFESLLGLGGGPYIPFVLTPHLNYYWTNDYVQRLLNVRDWSWIDMSNTFHFTNRNQNKETGTRVWRSSVYFDQNSLPAEPHLTLPPGATSFTDPDAPRGSHYWYLLEVYKGPLDREFTGPFDARALGINVGPGPQDLIAGTPGAGFYGEVPVSELITGTALASAIGLTAGTAQHSNEPWLKFNLDGRTLFVAKKPYRHSISWNHISTANAVYGSRTIEINGETYKVRLLKGSATDPYVGGDGADLVGTHGSEWNRLFYPLIPNPVNKPSYPISGEGLVYGAWMDYTETELVMVSAAGNGNYSYCQEARGGGGGPRLSWQRWCFLLGRQRSFFRRCFTRLETCVRIGELIH